MPRVVRARFKYKVWGNRNGEANSRWRNVYASLTTHAWGVLNVPLA